jgi:hypothetical protein
MNLEERATVDSPRRTGWLLLVCTRLKTWVLVHVSAALRHSTCLAREARESELRAEPKGLKNQNAKPASRRKRVFFELP